MNLSQYIPICQRIPKTLKWIIFGKNNYLNSKFTSKQNYRILTKNVKISTQKSNNWISSP